MVKDRIGPANLFGMGIWDLLKGEGKRNIVFQGIRQLNKTNVTEDFRRYFVF
jgi:hypothetical protein